MQDAIVALIVAVAATVLAVKIWRAVRRRCRSKGKPGCDSCCKCG